LNWAQTSTFSRKHTPKIDTWEQRKEKKKEEKGKNLILNIFHKYLFNWFNGNMTNFVGFLKEVEKPPNCFTIFKLFDIL
jgi:hypothetical protein